PRNVGVFGVRDKPKVEADLVNFGLLYRMYLDTNNRAPSKLEDLDRRDFRSQGYEFFEKGYYTVYWNTDVNRLPNPSNTVLVYERETRAGSRFVLMANCTTVREVSAAEFNQLPKAGQ